MKRLATKLYKLQLKGELSGPPPVLLPRFNSPEDYIKFIRQEMVAHARRMHLYNLGIKMTKKGSIARVLYARSRKRLHNWLDQLESGYINYL